MRRIENMYMSFKGVFNDDVGAKLIGMPIRQATAIRGDKQTLPGRDGFLLLPTGYQEITVKQDIAVPGSEALQAVKRWLSGAGDLVFGDHPDYAYEAAVITVSAMSSIAKRLTGQKLTVTFTCQPFLHLVDERPIVLTAAKVFSGLGDVNALPLIAVEGSGAQELTVNGRSMDLTLTAGKPLFIDSDAGIAYTLEEGGMAFAGEKVNVKDDWFELYPGNDPMQAQTFEKNSVSFTAGITRVTITPRWRFL